MGISGLLPFLEKATKQSHVSEFRGTTVAVDTYCWLHKGAISCAVQLASGEDTQSLVKYCTKYIKLLQSYDIKPILVFDGNNLPAKAGTELKRREARQTAKKRAAELLKLGKTAEAQNYLKQSVNITPEMASQVIKECHKIGVDCIVAPYESDAQLAYLALKGVVEVIITEDSDLLLFGCPKVLYKLDLKGNGSLVDATKIHQAMAMRPDSYTFDKFRYMCILSGCDYLESLPGIGLKKAQKFIKLTEETNPMIFLNKVPRYLNMQHLTVTEEYKNKFMIADATFKHQTVFDPFSKKLVPLTEVTTDPKYCINAGKLFDNDLAYQIALGNKHPSSHQQLGSWNPEEAREGSIWSGACKVKKKSEALEVSQRSGPYKVTQKRKRPIKITLSDEDEEAEDNNLDKEISVYFQKPETLGSFRNEEPVVGSPRDEKTGEERISPVFVKNPFIKKLSKFNITDKTEQEIVKSRYFSTDNSSTETVENNINLTNSPKRTSPPRKKTLGMKLTKQTSLQLLFKNMAK